MEIKKIIPVFLMIFMLAGCASTSVLNSAGMTDITVNAEEPVLDEPVESARVPLVVGEKAMFDTIIPSYSYSTKFAKGDKARDTNIKLACEAINGIVVEPEQLFSFNEATGPTNAENGYKLARIFIKGRKEKGYGGGVCQVSSTLFNAAEGAGMEIVERHPHSRKVEYVPPERDAAVSYGSIDLKFINTKPYAVRVKAAVGKDNTVYVTIERV